MPPEEQKRLVSAAAKEAENDPQEWRSVVAIYVAGMLFVTLGSGSFLVAAYLNRVLLAKLLPWWLAGGIGAAVSILPVWVVAGRLDRWWVRRRLWRMAKFLCDDCGYNLTGDASGRCPECGRPITPSSAEQRS